MGTLLKLAPLAVGLVAFASVVWFLVHKNVGLGTGLIAAFLLGHGLVHIMFAAPPPVTAGDPAAEFAFDLNRSWPVTARIVDPVVLRLIVVVLVAVVVVGYGLGAMSTVGLVVPQTAWPSLIVVSTIASGALMAIGLSPALALGIGIDAFLLWIALAAIWLPGRVVPGT